MITVPVASRFSGAALARSEPTSRPERGFGASRRWRRDRVLGGTRDKSFNLGCSDYKEDVVVTYLF